MYASWSIQRRGNCGERAVMDVNIGPRFELPTIGPDSYEATIRASFRAPDDLVAAINARSEGKSPRNAIEFRTVHRAERTASTVSGTINILEHNNSKVVFIEIGIEMRAARGKRKLSVDEILTLLAEHIDAEIHWHVTVSYHYSEKEYESLIPLPIPLNVP